MDAKYVPIDEVAEHFSVSVSTIRAWLRRDQIPNHTYIKVGNTYRFCIPEVSKALTHRDGVPEEVGGEVISYGAARREEALRTPEDANQVLNFDQLDEDQ